MRLCLLLFLPLDSVWKSNSRKDLLGLMLEGIDYIMGGRHVSTSVPVTLLPQPPREQSGSGAGQ